MRVYSAEVYAAGSAWPPPRAAINFIIGIWLEGAADREQLWARQLGPFEFELCCWPELLDDILTDPGSGYAPITGGEWKGGFYIIRPDGRGAAFSADGTFRYFGTFS